MSRRPRYVRAMSLAACLCSATLALGACGGDEESSPSASADKEAACQPDKALASLESSGKVFSTGPNGETPAAASTVKLTDEELAKVKAMNATAAIALHTSGDNWTQAQTAGAKSEFEKLGIKLISTTAADFKPDVQVANLETVLARKPDVMLSIPVDPVATAAQFKKVAAAGTKIVFMDVPADGMTAGKDYTSVVSADSYGNGVIAAHLLAKAVDCKGTVGILRRAEEFYVTDQRWFAVRDILKKEYPEIKTVVKAIGAPDYAKSAQAAANAMLTQNPDMKGMWAVWDVPAEGAMEAARANGRADLQITAIDLGENVAVALAKKKLMFGLGAQRPYEQGQTEARLAAYALLDKEAPPYVVLPSLQVNQDNVEKAWKDVYFSDPPASVVDAGG